RCWGGVSGWDPPPGQFVEVAIGPAVLLAVSTDGTLVEWGSRQGRQPEAGTRVAANNCQACVIARGGNVECRDQKGKSSGLGGPVTAFAPTCAGGCGLRPDGTVACIRDETGSPPPPAGAHFTEITSTLSRVCAVSSQGQLSCWGTPWPGPNFR